MIFYLALAALLLLAPVSQAYAPLLPDGNENISSAMFVSDPETSWAVYDTLIQDQPQYYSFDIEKGKRVLLSLLMSANPMEKGFQPEMALLGPGLQSNGKLPGYVRVPEGYGVVAMKSNRSKQAIYEPFGPCSYYKLADLDIAAPESGRYYVAVYSNSNNGNNGSNSRSNSNGNANGNASGHYDLAIGYREKITFTERFLTPFRLISIYLWEGQSLSTILMPMLVAALAGMFVVWRNFRRTPFSSAGTLAGFLFLGTSATVLAQMVFSLVRAPAGAEVVISLLLAVIPAILGVAAIRLSQGEAGILQRALLAVIGTIALLAGSGLIVGPLLAIAASVLPSKQWLNTK